MLLTYSQLCKLVDQDVISGLSSRDQVNGASIDLTLGRWLYLESPKGHVVDLAAKQTPTTYRHDLYERPYTLQPGEFVLAQTRELFNLPNDMALEYKLKSSLARAGLNHLLAGWADPGWHGSVLTLELHNVLNHHALLLSPDMKIGQAVFWRGQPVPQQQSYAVRGRYNNNTEAQPSKGAV